jgi:hypothetical protein
VARSGGVKVMMSSTASGTLQGWIDPADEVRAEDRHHFGVLRVDPVEGIEQGVQAVAMPMRHLVDVFGEEHRGRHTLRELESLQQHLTGGQHDERPVVRGRVLGCDCSSQALASAVAALENDPPLERHADLARIRGVLEQTPHGGLQRILSCRIQDELLRVDLPKVHHFRLGHVPAAPEAQPDRAALVERGQRTLLPRSRQRAPASDAASPSAEPARCPRGTPHRSGTPALNPASRRHAATFPRPSTR